MIEFLDAQPRKQVGQQGGGEGSGNHLWEYQSSGDEFHASISLADFCGIEYRNRPRGERGQIKNRDLQHKAGKLTIPSFDGSSVP